MYDIYNVFPALRYLFDIKEGLGLLKLAAEVLKLINSRPCYVK